MAINLAGGTITSSTILGDGQFIKNICPTFGLVGYWDAGITSSWTDGSSVLYDLSGNNNNLSPYGGVATGTFGSALAWNFNAAGKFFEGSGMSNAPTKNATIEAWIYPAASEIVAGDMGTIFQWKGASSIYHSFDKSNAKLANYWYGHPPEGYHESVAAMTRSAWHYTVGQWDFSQSCVHQWVDMTTGQVTGVQGNASAGTVIQIGREVEARQFSGGIALIRVWNRALLAHEILNNYLVEKARFGL